jgi:hypothetical protein
MKWGFRGCSICMHGTARRKMHVLFHPNECLDMGDEIITTRRTKNPIEILASASEYGFEFVSAGEYRKMIRS